MTSTGVELEVELGEQAPQSETCVRDQTVRLAEGGSRPVGAISKTGNEAEGVHTFITNTLVHGTILS